MRPDQTRQFFREIPVLWGDFYRNLPSRRTRWEGYEKIASAIFEWVVEGAAVTPDLDPVRPGIFL
jgi:hypothetical protein